MNSSRLTHLALVAAALASAPAMALTPGAQPPDKYRAMARETLAEIAGCFAFWAWLRLGRSAWWLGPGMVGLAVFAWLLTLAPASAAGRAYAAYGGIYIVMSLVWLWGAEGHRPDRWDIAGGAICLAGAAIILWGPRGS